MVFIVKPLFISEIMITRIGAKQVSIFTQVIKFSDKLNFSIQFLFSFILLFTIFHFFFATRV